MRLSKWWQFALALVVLAVVGDVFVFWHVLSGGVNHVAPEMEFDTAGAIWTNAWVAHSLAHFQNPFFSSNLMNPFGLNLLANVYNTGFSIVFAPVTWLFGPITAVNAQIMAVPVFNTLAMGWCLRRVSRRDSLCVAGAIMWGFSPFVIASLAKGWTNVGFLVLPPVLFLLFDELVTHKRWSARRCGVVIALVVVVQYFIDSEILTICALGAVVGLAVICVQRRQTLKEDWPRYRSAAAWAIPLSVILLAGPVLYGTFGPHHTPSWVRSEGTFKSFLSPLLSDISTLHSSITLANSHFSIVPNPSYVGAGVLVIIVAVLVATRLPDFSRTVFIVGLFGLWCSVGPGPWWSPYPLIEDVPLLHNITLPRFIIVTWFAAIVLVVFGADFATTWLREKGQGARVAVASVVAILAVAFVPPLVAVAQSSPVSASATNNDAALSWVLQQPGHHVVMGFPFPSSVRELLQQATTGNFGFNMPGGEWPQIDDAPEPVQLNLILVYASMDVLTSQPSLSRLQQMAQWMHTWGVTDVIVPKVCFATNEASYQCPNQFAAIVTAVLGAPITVDGEWVWTNVSKRTLAPTSLTTAWATCINPTAVATDRVVGCVLANPTS